MYTFKNKLLVQSVCHDTKYKKYKTKITLIVEKIYEDKKQFCESLKIKNKINGDQQIEPQNWVEWYWQFKT